MCVCVCVCVCVCTVTTYLVLDLNVRDTINTNTSRGSNRELGFRIQQIDQVLPIHFDKIQTETDRFQAVSQRLKALTYDLKRTWDDTALLVVLTPCTHHGEALTRAGLAIRKYATVETFEKIINHGRGSVLVDSLLCRVFLKYVVVCEILFTVGHCGSVHAP